MRRWLGYQMRKWADRIDPRGAPKIMGWRFRFVLHQGIVFDDKGPGAQLAYLGDDEYEKAFELRDGKLHYYE